MTEAALRKILSWVVLGKNHDSPWAKWAPEMGHIVNHKRHQRTQTLHVGTRPGWGKLRACQQWGCNRRSDQWSADHNLVIRPQVVKSGSNTCISCPFMSTAIQRWAVGVPRSQPTQKMIGFRYGMMYINMPWINFPSLSTHANPSVESWKCVPDFAAYYIYIYVYLLSYVCTCQNNICTNHYQPPFSTIIIVVTTQIQEFWRLAEVSPGLPLQQARLYQWFRSVNAHSNKSNTNCTLHWQIRCNTNSKG